MRLFLFLLLQKYIFFVTWQYLLINYFLFELLLSLAIVRFTDLYISESTLLCEVLNITPIRFNQKTYSDESSSCFPYWDTQAPLRLPAPAWYDQLA